MPMTDQDARALTHLARRIRTDTPGACEWDEAGTWAVLSRLIGQHLATTIERVTRHAADPEAKTPGAINRPFVPAAAEAGAPRPPKPEEAVCGCGIKGPHKHPPAQRAENYVADIRAAMRANRDGMCSHGVKRERCVDHRDMKATEDVETTGGVL